MNHLTVPIVRSLFVCERVEPNLLNGNLTLHNCFRTMNVPIGGLARPFFVVAYLAEAFGQVACQTVMTLPDTLAPIFSSRGVLTFTDPLGEQRLIVKVDCQYPVAGVNDITLWANGEMVAHSPLLIKPL